MKARRFGWVLGATALVAALAACGGGKDKDTSVSTTSTTVKVSSTTDGTGTTASTSTDETTSTAPIVTTPVDPEISLDTTIPDDTSTPDTDPPAQAELPADGPATVGGVSLPAGKVLVVSDQRLAWITDAAVPGAAGVWKQLYDQFATTGLYPMLLYDDDQPPLWEEADDGFFPNAPNPDDDRSLEQVLTDAASNFDPPRTFDGLAPASTGPEDVPATEALIAALPDTRILLVEAPDGPSALPYTGWIGNATYDSAAAIATAARSWAERYGAIIVAVGPNSLRLGITKPPTAAETAALSKELALMDPDLETGGAPIDMLTLNDGLVGQHMWTFWWAH